MVCRQRPFMWINVSGSGTRPVWVRRWYEARQYHRKLVKSRPKN
jgi:hypothetical protein